MASQVVLLHEGAILLARGILGACFRDVGRRVGSACLLAPGQMGLVALYLLIEPSIPCLFAPGTIYTPPRVRVMCCSLLCTHSKSFYQSEHTQVLRN